MIQFPSFHIIVALVCIANANAESPRGSQTMDPNDPSKTRPIISRSEREEIGLTPKTWPGVIAPEVSTALSRLEEKTAEWRNPKGVASIRKLLFMKMGMVYVEVRVNGNPHSVLDRLTARDFHVVQILHEHPGFVGYVDRSGLNKLGADSSVVAVCLDQQPLPEMPPTIYKHNLPSEPPSEEDGNKPGVAEGKIDVDVYRAFAIDDRVDVGIHLAKPADLPDGQDPQNPTAGARPSPEEEEELRGKVLADLTANEFWVSGVNGASIYGYVTAEGAAKLAGNPNVNRVYLPELQRVSRPAARSNR